MFGFRQPNRDPRSSSSFVWLQVLLTAALACVVLILVEAYRAARSSQIVAEHALRDYASFAAWSYRQQLTAALRNQIDELLGPVNHGEALHNVSGIPDARQMGHFIRWSDACQCHRPLHGPLPLRYYGFRVGSDTLMIGNNLAGPTQRGWLADPPNGVPIAVPVVDDGERAFVNTLLTNAARRVPRPAWGYDMVIANDGEQRRYFASRPMPTIRNDTIVYAIEYSEHAMDSLFATVLGRGDLLPPSLVGNRRNVDVVDVEIRDAQGGVLFASTSESDWEIDAETALPADYGGLLIRTRLNPELAQQLLIGGVPKSRVPLLLVVLTITGVLSVLAAVQLRRESRFASERTNFVANVSHELRTPLTQVRLVLDTLKLGRGENPQVREEALALADREVLRLQHLVEGVLRYARGSRNNKTPRAPLDAAVETRAVIAEFAPLARPKDVTLQYSGDENVAALLQPGALRQVLLNLLDNALKYGRDGSTVTVALQQHDGLLQLSVADQGSGVAKDERDRIWQAFERGRAAEDRVTGGSGIGLTVVSEIAHAHGGKAWIEDAPGGGARFVVTFAASRS